MQEALCPSNALSRTSPIQFANMDPTYPLVPIANFIACILVLVSLSKSMFQSWNVGACSFAIWTAIMSFITAVDSIIWADTIQILAPVWCDIGEAHWHEISSACLNVCKTSHSRSNRISCCCSSCILRNHTEALFCDAPTRTLTKNDAGMRIAVYGGGCTATHVL